MFPFSFEWVWDMGHMVFMGGLWYAVGILATGMGFVIVKSIIDTASGDTGDHGGHH